MVVGTCTLGKSQLLSLSQELCPLSKNNVHDHEGSHPNHLRMLRGFKMDRLWEGEHKELDMQKETGLFL